VAIPNGTRSTAIMMFVYAVAEWYEAGLPLELHLTTSELWFGQEQEGILP